MFLYEAEFTEQDIAYAEYSLLSLIDPDITHEEREEEMKSLKEAIVKEMEIAGISSQNTGLVEGKIINKASFKYNDEIAILNYW